MRRNLFYDWDMEWSGVPPSESVLHPWKDDQLDLNPVLDHVRIPANSDQPLDRRVKSIDAVVVVVVLFDEKMTL